MLTPGLAVCIVAVFDLVRQTGSSAEEEGKLATIDVYFGGVGVHTPSLLVHLFPFLLSQQNERSRARADVGT
jgi:hypothetical protein